jgi:hypothetical protein
MFHEPKWRVNLFFIPYVLRTTSTSLLGCYLPSFDEFPNFPENWSVFIFKVKQSSNSYTFSEMSAAVCQQTRHNIPEQLILRQHRLKKKTHISEINHK